MSLAEIKAMSTVERIQTMELLWDSLILDEKEVRSPGWHEGILKKRKQQLESGKSKSIDLAHLKSLFCK